MFDYQKYAHRFHLGVAAHLGLLVVLLALLIGTLAVLPDEWQYYPFLGIGVVLIFAYLFNRWQMRTGEPAGRRWYMFKLVFCQG